MLWSDFALQSLEEIIIWYELEAGRQVADSNQPRFSISPLLRQINRLNLREKNQKLFVNVE